MLSISDPITLGSDAEQYYLDKAKEAYYTDGKLGQWFGGAAKALELSDAVQPHTFHEPFKGFSPAGTKELVKSAAAAPLGDQIGGAPPQRDLVDPAAELVAGE